VAVACAAAAGSAASKRTLATAAAAIIEFSFSLKPTLLVLRALSPWQRT
jgi:hypothetical protein